MVAPEFDQSGVSHSLSLNDPLRLRAVGERRYAVKGTPTDCVIMGSMHLLKERRPNLILSGVNRGRNTGEDVIYSGTVAGAVEGTILGIPSVALSQSYNSRSDQPPYWETATRFGPDIIRKLLDAEDAARRAGQRQFPELHAQRGEGHRGDERWAATIRSGCASTSATTAAAMPITGSPMCRTARTAATTAPTSRRSADNKITVTPLRIDMTDEPFMTKLAELFAGRKANSDRLALASRQRGVQHPLEAVDLERLLQRADGRGIASGRPCSP